MVLAYFDCFAGISGDMTLGALVHLGVPLEWLTAQLRSLPLDGFHLKAESVTISGISAVKVHVETEETHHHRHLDHIVHLIDKSSLPADVKANALGVFDRLAEAEASVHGGDKNDVHFHEVGALDALVDVIGSCLGLHHLGVHAVKASALPLGGGFVKCDHGVLPVPAPAVLELLKGVPTYSGSENKELVTPTGAAILRGNNATFGEIPPLRIKKVGYGAGDHHLQNRPNLLRIVIGEPMDAAGGVDGVERLVMVETCIDDMSPELFGYVMEKLFSDGALDVYWTAVQMKKNRPGTLISVLCDPVRKPAIVDRLLSETTTLGVRFYEVSRKALPREQITVNSAFGPISVKRIVTGEGGERLIPEYDVCRNLAKKENLPLRQVYETILKTAALG